MIQSTILHSSEFTFANFLHLNNLLTKVCLQVLMFHEDSSIIHYCFSVIRGVQASDDVKVQPHLVQLGLSVEKLCHAAD